MITLRKGQQEAIEYDHGYLGIIAVPGSGKTFTLSHLAAKLVASENIEDGQEILVVTLVNSAVHNFSFRIARTLKEMGLLPGVGYRVRTLHGLAYDIVREMPQLAGLDNRFTVADERATGEILTRTSIAWVRSHPEIVSALSTSGLNPSHRNKSWPLLVKNIAQGVIRLAKDRNIPPWELNDRIEDSALQDDMIIMAVQVYQDYQRALNDRGALDFDDLISSAYHILSANPDYLAVLQDRWPYILEDEAQDSSLTQEKMLHLLSKKSGNWVRVGDPNQAIYETFTTANPKLLRDFVSRPNVSSTDLPQSGRSSRSILDLANYLITWTSENHPRPEIRQALNPPLIQETPPGDPQPNPVDDPGNVHIVDTAYSPEREIEHVAGSAARWIADNPDKTCAILVPRNFRGGEVIDALDDLKAPSVELLSTSQSSRISAAVLRDILRFFSTPLQYRTFARVFKTIAEVLYEPEENRAVIDALAQLVNKYPQPELLFSSPETIQEFCEGNSLDALSSQIFSDVINLLSGWQKTILLPVDEMLITIAADLFMEPAELALAHKLSLVLKSALQYYPDWDLPQFADELDAIAQNRYKMNAFSDAELGFNPDEHKGEVVVSTFHKAKGLEWDRVYLMSVNNYNFPSADPRDTYFSEKWFVKGNRNLEAETFETARKLFDDELEPGNVDHDMATQKARLDFCAERLRMFFVGITRAKEELVITWNTGRRGDSTEALPLQALREFWRNRS